MGNSRPGGCMRSATRMNYRYGRSSEVRWMPQPYSNFRKAWLKRQVLNFGVLDPDVAVCRLMQLYKCRSSFILR
jgi:hypothetical protein